MNYKPGCYNCLNWYRNKEKALGRKLYGPRDLCCGGFHNRHKKGPGKDGVWSGECENFRTGPYFCCVHHVCCGWDIMIPKLVKAKRR